MNGVRWAWSGFHTLLSGCKDSGQVDRVPDCWTVCLMSRVVLKEGFLASNIHSTQPKESIGRCEDRTHATFLKSLCQLKSENYWFKGTQVLYQEVGKLYSGHWYAVHGKHSYEEYRPPIIFLDPPLNSCVNLGKVIIFLKPHV